MAAGLLRLRISAASLHMALPGMRRSLVQKRWLFASWRTGLSRARSRERLFPRCLSVRGHLAGDEGEAPARGSLSDRLDLKRETGSHKTLSRDGWADVVFAFHDGDEVGPTDDGSRCAPHRLEGRG